MAHRALSRPWSFWTPRQVGFAEAVSQAGHNAKGLGVFECVGEDPACVWRVDALVVVVVVEEVEGSVVVGDDGEQGLGLVSREVAPLGSGGDELDGLVEVVEASLVDRVAMDEGVAQHARGPDAELRAAAGVDGGEFTFLLVERPRIPRSLRTPLARLP